MVEKILIVDDDPDTLRMVGLMLERTGYTTLASTNGMDALAQAEAECPDLILLDVMMPIMNGYEVARKLKFNPITSDIPIIMLTAKTQHDDKVAGFGSGADDYLTKPILPSDLQAHIKALLARTTRTRKTRSQDVTEQAGFTIGLLAARGGLGVTTTAVNLAGALQQFTKKDVILAELRPGFGTLAADLGFDESHALVEILGMDPGSITRQLIKDRLLQHQTGINLLLAPSQPKNASLINASAQFESLVKNLRFLAPFVVLDLGAGLPQLTQKLIKMCNRLIVIVEPVPNSIMHSKALLVDLDELGFNKKYIMPIIVNRIQSETQMNWSYVQERLEIPVPIMIMSSPEEISQANRNRTTSIAEFPNSAIGHQYKKLANLVVDLSINKP